MKIFTAAQIREGDAYTIRREPVTSLDLMERAATRCSEWIAARYPPTCPLFLFCGTGNNGGDGLAISRLLLEKGYRVHTAMVYTRKQLSADCAANLQRLEHTYGANLRAVYGPGDWPSLPADAVVVDALFGTGLNRPLQGLGAEAVRYLNAQSACILAVDMPSGMLADASSAPGPVIRATHTLSFEGYKLAFFMPENAAHLGEIHVLPIGIHPDFIADTPTPYRLSDVAAMEGIYRPRRRFAHKGHYGHALLIAGGRGKTGAAVLAARGCLRAGVGLLTCQVPESSYAIMQTAVPEAMCLTDPHADRWTAVPDKVGDYTVLGIGPGIGRHPETAAALDRTLQAVSRPLVLDADALNILAEHPALMDKVPAGSLLTPHPREFQRLFGASPDDFQRLDTQRRMSREHQWVIVLKGHRTAISSPDGELYFNSTGNPGMATGGSGDVLTGILTALLAQGYAPLDAARLGVYLHGLAGDLAAAAGAEESLSAGDIPEALGRAFRTLSGSASPRPPFTAE